MNVPPQLVIPPLPYLDGVRLDHNRCIRRCNTEAKAQGRAAGTLRLAQPQRGHQHPGARQAMGQRGGPLQEAAGLVIRGAAEGGRRKKRKTRGKRKRKKKRKTKKRKKRKKRKRKKTRKKR